MKHLVVLLFLLLPITGLIAQSKRPGGPAAADKIAVEATVRKLFDSMRAADTVLARAVMAPQMRLIIVSKNKEGQTTTREVSGKQFRSMIASRPPQTLDERFWDGQLQVDGDLASYWCKYAFFNGGKFSHCGTDVFQLVRTPAAGWQIVNLAYTVQPEHCDLKAIPKQ